MTTKEKYHRRKENGLCVNCGKEKKENDDYVFCRECYEMIKEREMKKYGPEGRWGHYNLMKLAEDLENMPDYLEKQFFLALEDLAEDEEGGD